MEDGMQRPSILIFLTLALSVSGSQLHAADRDYHWPGAPEDFQHKILGTWALVSVEAVNADGSRSQPFGPNPVGRAVFDSSGNFILLNMAAAFTGGQASESQAIFGTYTVDEAARTLTWHVDACNPPKRNGADQTHSIELLTEDDLRTRPRATALGEAVALFTWRRVK
jgi:hypothetical protein